MKKGLFDQVAGSGRDPSPYALSDDRIQKYLVDELFPNSPNDPLEIKKDIMGKVGGRVNPEALKYPRPK